MIPIAYGIECQRTTSTENIPCTLVSSWKPSSGCDSNMSVYFNGENVQNLSWQNGLPYCNATFNLTEAGIYQINSTIEDFVITLERPDNMLSIILLQIFLIAFFIVIGLPHKVGFVKILTWSIAVLEVLVTVWMVYINEIGGQITNILHWNAITVLIIGGLMGFITLLMINVKLMNVEKNKGLEDDGYTKWMYK